MHGKIYFNDLESFTEWLGEFCGKCTAVFEARPNPRVSGAWIVEFSGGH